jgi:hypothetical protein
MKNFFINNYEWLFSGVLSGLIFWFLGQKNGYKKAIKQKMKIRNNSSGVQVGHDYYNKTDRD